MKANAAVAFCLSWIALWLLQKKREGRGCRLGACGCASILALVGLFTLSEYAAGWDAGIDQLLFQDGPDAAETSHPGRMAPHTALSFFLLGLAILLLDVETRRGHRPAQFMALGVAAIALGVSVGYAYRGGETPVQSPFTSMALHTGIGFLIASVGILPARPDCGWMSTLTSEGPGGMMARRLVPSAILVLVAVGWLRLLGQDAGLYGLNLGLGLRVAASIFVLSLMITFVGSSLDRADAQRRKGQERILLLNRLLRTISEINQLIVRERDRDKVLSEACRILVEHGGFRVAWIGMADFRTGEVTPAAQAGFTDGFLEIAKVRCDDSPRAQGPSGTAMRTGQHVVFSDIGDERLALWREDSLKRGYQAMAAFPLRVRDRVIGALTVYAADAELLRDEMVALLLEMAGDIGYALQGFDEIAKREQAEHALRESERSMRELMRHARCSLWSGQIEPRPGGENRSRMSDAFRWLIRALPDDQATQAMVPLDVPAGSSYTTCFHQSVPEEERVAMDALSLAALRRGDDHYSQEFRCFDRDGRVHWIHEDVSLQALAPGRWKVFGVWVDVTERRQAEEEIRALNAELEQRVRDRTAQLDASNKELEAFAYSVSHDLRAPLRSIDGFSQVLLEDCPESLGESGLDALQRVRKAAQHMVELIDDLLKLSRVTRGEMQREKVDLTALAGSIVSDLRQTQPEREVDVTIADGLVAQGDSRLLRAALENLLGNAWKFTGKTAHARVEVGRLNAECGVRNAECAAPRTPRTENRQPNTELALYVRDNGAGFDMAYADKLFGAFQRLHSSREFPGTGVGLATVQRIVHRHGGRVWAEGKVGQGATFYFTLG